VAAVVPIAAIAIVVAIVALVAAVVLLAAAVLVTVRGLLTAAAGLRGFAVLAVVERLAGLALEQPLLAVVELFVRLALQTGVTLGLCLRRLALDILGPLRKRQRRECDEHATARHRDEMGAHAAIVASRDDRRKRLCLYFEPHSANAFC